MNLTKLNLEFDIRDYTGRVLAIRMPGKKVVDRIVRPREVVRVPTSEDCMYVNWPITLWHHSLTLPRIQANKCEVSGSKDQKIAHHD